MNNDQLVNIGDDDLDLVAGGNGSSVPTHPSPSTGGGLDLSLGVKLGVKLGLGLGINLLGIEL